MKFYELTSQVYDYLDVDTDEPWLMLNSLESLIKTKISKLYSSFTIRGETAIHKTARVSESAQISGPTIIGPDCFVSNNTIIRGGVVLIESVTVGPGCELKQIGVGARSAFAHFNYIGNSVIGDNVNFEAGAVTANHYNERTNKTIHVNFKSKVIELPTQKFGAHIGDGSKIGANAVTSPGTILDKNSVVRRLELVQQTNLET